MTRERKRFPKEDEFLGFPLPDRKVRDSYEPWYDSKKDYNTNSKSYYDYLARVNQLMQLLADRIWDYDKELAIRFREWDKNLEEFPHEVYKILTKWLDEGKISRNPDNGKIQYTVGKDGDFDTINHAIEHIEDLFYYPPEIEIYLLNDYIMKEQVTIKNRDFHFITITSDNPVKTEYTSDIKTINTLNGAKYTPFFHIVDSNAPKINALFTLDSGYNDSVHRLSGMVSENSNITIEKKKGFTSFSWAGLVLLDKSNGVCIGSNFNDNGNFYEIKNPSEDELRTIYEGKGVLVQNSELTGDGLTANKCGDVGVHVQLASNARFSGATINSCGHHAIVVSQSSSVTAKDGEYCYCNDDNVVCETASSLDISGSNCSYATFHNGVIAHRGGKIIFRNGIARDNGGWGLHAVNDGHINAESARVSGNGKSGCSIGRLGYLYFRHGKSNNNGQHGINISKTSQVMAQDAEITGNEGNGISNSGGWSDVTQAVISHNEGHGLAAYSGGYNNGVNGTIIENNGRNGVMCDNGRTNMRKSTVRNSSGYDIRVASSGHITLDRLTTTNTKNVEFVVSSGGFIQANDCKGFVNMTPNVFRERGLVISNSLVEGDT